jgi:hypothetical protein
MRFIFDLLTVKQERFQMDVWINQHHLEVEARHWEEQEELQEEEEKV